jgi:hypothetical protein
VVTLEPAKGALALKEARVKRAERLVQALEMVFISTGEFPTGCEKKRKPERTVQPLCVLEFYTGKSLAANNDHVPRSCSKTRFKLPSGHGFNRAEYKAFSRRLQPLKVSHAPQGVKPAPSGLLLGTTEVVP